MPRYTLTLKWTALGLQYHDPQYDSSSTATFGSLTGGYPFRRSQAIKVAKATGAGVTGPGGNFIGNYITDTTSGAIWQVEGSATDVHNMISTWQNFGYVTVTGGP